MGEAICSYQVDKESPQKEEIRMTTKGHVKGSKRSHKQMERSDKVVGMKK